jgi:hypothetical protein
LAFTDSPIINSPFEKPQWHFELDGDGQPTGEKLPDRRESLYVVPVPLSIISRHRNPRAIAFIIALSTCWRRRAHGSCPRPSGVSTTFLPPRFRIEIGTRPVMVRPSLLIDA